MQNQYDALLLVSFGGPEGMDEVIPFLKNVLRGRNVPPERLEEVAQHYRAFGGVSPLNAQNRALMATLKEEFLDHEIRLPIYWGNRNWRPFLKEAVAQMAEDGVEKALAFVTSAYSSYSGCRQYRENIQQARHETGAQAPRIEKLRVFFNHPGFVAANADRVDQALNCLPQEKRSSAFVLFTAHSIPLAMAANCRYREQLQSTAQLVAERLQLRHFRVVYQSRSGPPAQPWLEPDVCDALEEVRQAGAKDVVLSPIGFVSDHMEVVYDLDHEAKSHGRRLGLNVVRAGSAGLHPCYVSMIRLLVEERVRGKEPLALGGMGLYPEQCSPQCCLYALRA